MMVLNEQMKLLHDSQKKKEQELDLNRLGNIKQM